MKGLTTVTMVIVLLQSGIYFDFIFFSVLQNFLFDEQMENTFFKKLERIFILL